MNVLPSRGLVEWLLSPSNLVIASLVLIGALIALWALQGLRRNLTAETTATGRARNQRRLDHVASRWQLLLLGTTGFVLSLASGYTTWAGMTNFTGESTLSLMVTFGIQGVMLIVAWLIGESFATGMNRRLPDGTHQGRAIGRADILIGVVLAILVVSIAFYWMLHSSNAIGWSRNGVYNPVDWTKFADVSAYFALGLIVLGVLAFNFSRGGELSLPYVQSSRIIIKNAVLWVMFLACMATSVFFSFDSLFTAIFPKEERARAAQLRAQNQVAGMVADIGSTIERRRLSELELLFRSKGWMDYDGHLTSLGRVSQDAHSAIEKFFNDQIEDKNRALNQQQERISSSQSGSAGLQSKKITLTEEVARLKGERPALAADLAEKKTELENRAKGVDAKRVEAQAEDRGAEGTLKQGKGPVYRQIQTDLARLQDAYKIQDERVRDSQKRLTVADTRIAQIERELAAVDGDLAKLKGEADTANQRIKMMQEPAADEATQKVDPSRALASFEAARATFVQTPTATQLMQVQTLCSNLHRAMVSTPITKPRVTSINCDAKSASEASTVMFALNEGLKLFEGTCAGGDKLEANKSTDALYGFARRCLADSGLPAKETDELRTRINFLELSRDDKAHPFVATLNAFQDGNRLAYLALAIAIAMDTLVFMSGLFGANAVRSPLSDVPSTKARSGRQLEAIVENALLPDTFDNARLVLNAMRPMTPREGFTARVLLHANDPHASDIRRVLNAASTIGAVRHIDSRDEAYEVRSELFEFLSVVAKKAFESNDEHARIADLRKVVTVALQPHAGDHADIVLQHCQPISERNGFSAEMHLSRMPADDAFIAQKVLNAGATMNYVQLDERADQNQRYYVHKQLYKTLLMISAANPKTGARSGAPRLAPPQSGQGTLEGGNLTQNMPSLGRDKSIAPPALPGFLSRNEGQRRRPGDDESENRSLENYFINCLAEAVGSAPEAYLGIAGETFGAALAAADAFKTVQRTNRTLNKLVEEKESDAQGKIERVYERLMSSAEAQTSLGQRALDAAYNQVLHNLPIITLLPGGPVETLLRSIIAQLEPQHGEQRLSPEEEDLLHIVKRLSAHLMRSPRDSAESWQRVQIGLGESNPGAGQVAFIANRAKRQGGA